MKRVLIAGPMPDMAGGIAKWTGHIKSYYDKYAKGSDVEVEFVYVRNILVKYVRTDGIINNIKRIIAGGAKYLYLYKDIRKKLKKGRYDVLHVASSASISLFKDLLLIKTAHTFGVKSIIHFHFGRIPDLEKKHNWEWKVLTKVLRKTDSAVVIDESSLKVLNNRGFDNVVYIPNPLSERISDIVRNNEDTERQPGEIIFVGQMLRTKGIYELIAACKEIPDIKLRMYGMIPAGTREKLLEAAGEQNEWLEVAGEIPYGDIIKKMCRASVFVLPTYTEGFPNVILESMACGCPIVTTPVGAIPEMLDFGGEEECGMCVEVGNVVQLKNAIEKMLSDRETAMRYGERARTRVLDLYSIKNVWEQLVGIWLK